MNYLHYYAKKSGIRSKEVTIDLQLILCRGISWHFHFILAYWHKGIGQSNCKWLLKNGNDIKSIFKMLKKNLTEITEISIESEVQNLKLFKCRRKWWLKTSNDFLCYLFFFLVRFLPGDYQHETACDDENRSWLSYSDSCQWKLITLLLSHTLLPSYLLSDCRKYKPKFYLSSQKSWARESRNIH